MPAASVPPPSAEVLPAERERDPELPLRALAWIVIAFSLLQVLLFAFGRDQGIFAVIGRGVLDGKMPYRDLWDFKPPGIFLVYAAAFGVFGNSMIAPRLVECLCLFAVVLGCRRLGGTLFGSRTAGLVGGALAALVHAQLEFWHTAQPETFAGAFTVAALVLSTTETSRKRRLLASSLVGVCFGCCFLLKPTLAAPALVCALYMAAHPPPPATGWLCRVVPFVGVGIGALLPIALVGGW
ncbi:MAG TPA: glycosyltransferase family 39 protein, partial [Polyangiaceae bacterium]|nr:glycosyltransferase family 39 protein [Polyangiaceae bacterium]